MAKLVLTIPTQTSWSQSDTLRLLLGDENAASLAASTPAGGELVATTRPLEGATRGGLDVGELDSDLDTGPYLFGLDSGALDGRLDFGSLPDAEIDYEFTPADICAVVPYGVSIEDAAGNESGAFETFDQVRDRPKGRAIRRLPPPPTRTKRR